MYCTRVFIECNGSNNSLFLKFYTFHFMECTFGRREEPTKNSMTEAALIVSSYLTPFVNLSM